MSTNANTQKAGIEYCCPACTSNRVADQWPTSRIPGNKMILWCSDCGYGWQHPLPSPSDIRYYYHRFPAYNIHADTEKEQGFSRRILRVNQLSPQGGRLLDIGSGSGVFLKLASRNGWEVQAIEPQQSAADYCERHFGVKPYVGLIEEIAIRAASFDVVTLWDVGEHVHTPLEFIDRCADLVVPGGLLALSIPNASGYPARLFRGNWRYVMFTHLSYFTIPFVYSVMSKRNLHLQWADHTIKAQSLLQGIAALLRFDVDTERIIRLGQQHKSGNNSSQRRTQGDNPSPKSNPPALLAWMRRLILKGNLRPLPIPRGDMMDLFFKKEPDGVHSDLKR